MLSVKSAKELDFFRKSLCIQRFEKVQGMGFYFKGIGHFKINNNLKTKHNSSICYLVKNSLLFKCTGSL